MMQLFTFADNSFPTWLLALASCLVATLPGCTTPACDPAAPTPPSYGTLAELHNRRVTPIKRLWASTVVEARWEDDKGKRRFEQGEGVLILDLPVKSAMTIGKLGNTKLWVGSNEKHFWMFDELDGRKLYWGHMNAPDGTGAVGGNATKRQATPLPIQPAEVPKLLAILPMPMPPDGAAAPPVKWQVITQGGEKHGCFVTQAFSQPIRYYIDPATSRPRRVELLNHSGDVSLVADLTGEELMELENAASGPMIAGRAEVTWPGSATKMNLVLHLSQITDARRKIKPEVFDLKGLTETLFKPEQVVEVRKEKE